MAFCSMDTELQGTPDNRKSIMCSIVTADMERRQNECRKRKIQSALNESKEEAVRRFDRLWRSGMCVSREGGMFWIHDIIQSTAFDETLLYCHCFDPAKLRDDQFAAWKAAWKPEPETGRKKIFDSHSSGKYKYETV